MGTLVTDAAGNLYGSTQSGGTKGAGVVFKLVRAGGGWVETVLHNFGNRKDGINPYTGMFFDQGHNLYGTTDSGGNYRAGMCQKSRGCGTIFKITPLARPE